MEKDRGRSMSLRTVLLLSLILFAYGLAELITQWGTQ